MGATPLTTSKHNTTAMAVATYAEITLSGKQNINIYLCANAVSYTVCYGENLTCETSAITNKMPRCQINYVLRCHNPNL